MHVVRWLGYTLCTCKHCRVYQPRIHALQSSPCPPINTHSCPHTSRTCTADHHNAPQQKRHNTHTLRPSSPINIHSTNPHIIQRNAVSFCIRSSVASRPRPTTRQPPSVAQPTRTSQWGRQPEMVQVDLTNECATVLPGRREIMPLWPDTSPWLRGIWPRCRPRPDNRQREIQLDTIPGSTGVQSA